MTVIPINSFTHEHFFTSLYAFALKIFFMRDNQKPSRVEKMVKGREGGGGGGGRMRKAKRGSKNKKERGGKKDACFPAFEIM